jgi:hypothetical protein
VRRRTGASRLRNSSCDWILEAAGRGEIFAAGHAETGNDHSALDDARAGRFHPANAALTHEFVAKTALGISPDDQPRWG